MAKIVALAIILGIILFFLRNINSDLFVPALVASGVILLFYVLSLLKNVFLFVDELIKLTGIDYEIYKIIFKMVGIAYLIEFGAGTIEDMGFKSIADKLVLIGKITIFTISMPIFYAVINILINLLK